jgi:hypothetical protein
VTGKVITCTISVVHHGNGGNEADQSARDEAGRQHARSRAALRQGSDAEAGGKGVQPAPEAQGDEVPQAAPECAHDAGLHHVDAP